MFEDGGLRISDSGNGLPQYKGMEVASAKRQYVRPDRSPATSIGGCGGGGRPDGPRVTDNRQTAAVKLSPSPRCTEPADRHSNITGSEDKDAVNSNGVGN